MKRIIYAVLIAFLGQSSISLAKMNEQMTKPIHSVTEKIRSELKQKLPNFNLESLIESPIKGLYEAKSGTLVLYVSADGRHVIQGDIFDTQRDKVDQNLTEITKRQPRAKILKENKLNEMIVYAPKQTKGIMTVFADLDCTYCRQLHKDVPKLNDLGVEVRYLAYPITAQGKGSYDKAVSVWCSENPKLALNSAIQGETIPPKTCINTVASQMEIGQKFGVRATPTVVFADGTVVPGYINPDVLAKKAILHAHKSS